MLKLIIGLVYIKLNVLGRGMIECFIDWIIHVYLINNTVYYIISIIFKNIEIYAVQYFIGVP